MNNTLYSKAWQRLEQNTHLYWQLLQELPSDVLRRQPEEGRWSMLQVMEHLAGAEAGCVNYLIRKNYTPLKPKGMPNGLRAFLLQLALKSPLRFKAPAIDALQPHNNSGTKELLQRWQQSREQLSNYIDKMPADKQGSLLFRHPIAGGLNMQQTLQFMADHLNHHKRQLNESLQRQGLQKLKQ